MDAKTGYSTMVTGTKSAAATNEEQTKRLLPGRFEKQHTEQIGLQSISIRLLTGLRQVLHRSLLTVKSSMYLPMADTRLSQTSVVAICVYLTTA